MIYNPTSAQWENYPLARAEEEYVTLGELPIILHEIWQAYVTDQITEQEYGTAADAIEGWWVDLTGGTWVYEGDDRWGPSDPPELE